MGGGDWLRARDRHCRLFSHEIHDQGGLTRASAQWRRQSEGSSQSNRASLGSSLQDNGGKTRRFVSSTLEYVSPMVHSYHWERSTVTAKREQHDNFTSYLGHYTLIFTDLWLLFRAQLRPARRYCYRRQTRTGHTQGGKLKWDF